MNKDYDSFNRIVAWFILVFGTIMIALFGYVIVGELFGLFGLYGKAAMLLEQSIASLAGIVAFIGIGIWELKNY